MYTRSFARAVALTASAFWLLIPATSASATDDTYTVPLHQHLPLTASSDGVEHESDCPVPDTKDGWHFVLPGTGTDFVKLTVTFEPGGEQVITSFGPPSDKHAYAASDPGATLVAAEAEVTGGDVAWFNLSHACPASNTQPSSSPTPSQSTSPTPPVTTPPASESSPASPHPSSSSSAAVTPPASSTPVSQNGGALAETGAQTVSIAGAALLLLGAGAGLVVALRRKGSGQRH
ncbi:hypothetical protein BM536_037950 [Streptomyces phaeoluteigriseus]|uniref:Gram-positive cocci surface proteins LPxTG domain-containing protein n=1 Tax=Streptomyces phaeoluteigriseus TaxID=114686 RepID=A0A1V6MHH4_9ACTN|nr:hypothetical protein [Streptomyces phaeoluteigriseus]OQD51798.1 hypothetical protein BM536_037950 [Streptomyces phaeoluteigriseus]